MYGPLLVVAPLSFLLLLLLLHRSEWHRVNGDPICVVGFCGLCRYVSNVLASACVRINVILMHLFRWNQSPRRHSSNNPSNTSTTIAKAPRYFRFSIQYTASRTQPNKYDARKFSTMPYPVCVFMFVYMCINIAFACVCACVRGFRVSPLIRNIHQN